MMQIARGWRVLIAGLAVGSAGVMGLGGAVASADPLFPPRPNPAPVPAPPAATQNSLGTLGSVGNSMPGTAPALSPPPVSSPLPAAAPAQVPAAPTQVSPPLAAAAPAQPSLLPASSGTLRDYFQGKGVHLEPQQPRGFKALDITLPMPPGWTQVPDPNVPDPFAVIANRSSNSLYTSNAQVVVYKLIGDFDPNEAITHGYVDSQQLPAWQTTNASLGNFGSFPSSIIEGTYRQNDMTLNTSRRQVIATSGPDRYLVSLAVTTDAAQAVAEAPATDAIVNGFRVSAPAGTAPAVPPAAPAQAAAQPLPALPTLPGLSPAPTR
ncbi:hypothetical protein A5707_03685 [Mycobacterium kyorinense]|uniref:Proline-rich 28 kDa antigen n=1 Tax=Mycobacterium kyorinense TaxID=487514 RepID=A0A1A2Z544_9MYCO|nr:LpqN/LpqT family lipoprotein [Mycobacterium kyorinense]OBI44291.1 hypothetical protein A5707_03685 [Mycobacterium kyorinense]